MKIGKKNENCKKLKTGKLRKKNENWKKRFENWTRTYFSSKRKKNSKN